MYRGLFRVLKLKIYAQNLEIRKISSNFATQNLIFGNMENVQEILEQVERIAKDPKTMTTEDRAFLREVAPQFGVKIKNTRCKYCYADAAILCAIECKKRLTPENPQDDQRRYILKSGVDVYFGLIRVNEVTLTDELAERIIAKGFERKYFAKCE